jgi:tRNA(fMet)-specific endonuclease VapC
VAESGDPPGQVARCVVDTDVVSFLFRDDSRADGYRAFLTGRELAVSFQTLAELRRWALLHRWGEARWRRLEGMLEPFSIFLVDEQVIAAWARITVERERLGRPIATGDAWIAATAWVHGLPLVTHNRRHFEQIVGLQLISEG